MLFQDGALFGSLNLYDNVAFPLRQHTEKGEEEIAEIVNRRMSEVGLGGEGEKMPNELSGGMRKRAGFARALVLEPEIVLFDEPDSGLDPVRTALLCELIKEIHAENGGCYVVITHDIMSARRVAEHISVLWKGRIVESGPAEELFASENPFVRQFLSGESAGPARHGVDAPDGACGCAARLAFICERVSASLGACAARRRAAPAARAGGGGRARRWRARRSRCGCSRRAATSTFVSSSSREYRDTQTSTSTSAKSRRGARQRRPAAARAQLGHRAAGRAGGVPVGQRARPRAGRRGRAQRAVRAARAGAAR